jgi:hypothetical protein
MTYQNHPVVLAPIHPQRSVVLALCLLIAGIPLAGAATIPQDGASPGAVTPPLECTILAWDLNASAQRSGASGLHADRSISAAPIASSGMVSPASDETIRRIVNTSNTRPVAFWDTHAPGAAGATRAASTMHHSDTMALIGVVHERLKGGRFGDTDSERAAATFITPPAETGSFNLLASQGSVIAGLSALFAAILLALLGYCAVISCVPANHTQQLSNTATLVVQSHSKQP